MKFDKVSIRQIPDDYASMTGLHKYNRSKMPQTFEFFQAYIGDDGRAITGLDEDSQEIAMMKDPVAQAEKQAEVRALRESLEKITRKDLSATSDYWLDFGIHIKSDSELILNKTNALHVIMYHVLVANRFAAPDRDSAALPQYRNAKYFAYVSERADEEAAVDKLTKDRAKSKLVNIYENHDLMVLIGQYLEGDKYKAGMSDKTLYNMLSTYIDNSKEPENLKRFVKAVDMDVSDLQFKITVDRAIKRKIIRHKDGYFQRGQANLGRTAVDVLNSLKKPEFASEFISIKEEVEEA